VSGASDANYAISFITGNLIVTDDLAMPYRISLPFVVK
jgi:hypothetical protein